MPKYQYKRYISRAFWNSLFAALSALIFVLIILYGWQAIRSVVDRLPFGGGEEEVVPEEADRLEQLEELRSSEEIPEAEKEALLRSLTTDDESLSDEEKMELLDKLKGDEAP